MYCDFAISKNEHIGDHPVVDILNEYLSEELQLLSELTLEQAVRNWHGDWANEKCKSFSKQVVEEVVQEITKKKIPMGKN